MRCFKHNDAEAVGICRNCLKGVCKECAIEVKNGIVCSDSCAEVINAYKKEHPVRAQLYLPILFIITGGAFFYYSYEDKNLRLLSFLGIAFWGIGIRALFAIKKTITTSKKS